jgi:hypothetical protein
MIQFESVDTTALTGNEKELYRLEEAIWLDGLYRANMESHLSGMYRTEEWTNPDESTWCDDVWIHLRIGRAIPSRSGMEPFTLWLPFATHICVKFGVQYGEEDKMINTMERAWKMSDPVKTRQEVLQLAPDIVDGDCGYREAIRIWLAYPFPEFSKRYKKWKENEAEPVLLIDPDWEQLLYRIPSHLNPFPLQSLKGEQSC